jgi:hypothetical protein
MTSFWLTIPLALNLLSNRRSTHLSNEPAPEEPIESEPSIKDKDVRVVKK